MIIAFLGFLTKTYIGKIRLINGLRLARNIENKNWGKLIYIFISISNILI